ncbi:MAG: hypothetical protein ACLFPF_06265 [Halanaerobiales bacterium]
MNKFLSLTKIQVKDFVGKSTASMGVENKILARLLMLLLAAIFAVPAGVLSVSVYKALEAINQPELLITILYINAVLFMFVFGIPFIISVFFFSRDAKFLSTLPVREDDLILSKLATVYLYLVLFSTLIMGPGLIVYLINTGLSVFLIIMTLIALIWAPVLPLLISSIVVLPFGNLFSNSSRRKMFILILNILMLVAIIAVQLFFGRFMENPEQIQQILLSGNFLELLGMRFPPSIWLTRMFLGSLKDTTLFIGLNIVLFFVLRVLARMFFRKSLLAYAQEGGISIGDIYYRKRSRSWQLMKRNIMIIVKEPMFLMNIGLSMILPVIMAAMMMFTGEFSLTMLNSSQVEPYLLLVICGVMASPSIIGNASSTAITREGQSFWETRVLPISAAENIKYRVMTTIILNFAGALLLLLILLFVLPITLKLLALAVLFCVSLTLFLSNADIIINIYRPLLNWTNPTAAIKNNLNVTLSLLIRAVIAGLVFLLYLAAPGLFANYELLILLGSIVFLGLYFIARSFVYSRGAERFNRISI